MTTPLPDTIAAVATAPGAAGIGVVRLSGPDAFGVADRILKHPSPCVRYPGHTLHRAVVCEPQTGEALDDALIAVFHAPRSFTGENIVEIHAHGGVVLLRRVLEASLHAGARAAHPGEFSERAFVNGKMDLAQAEAVADLVGAQTVAAARAARRQVGGELSRAVGSAGDALKEALALIEASIDFPEDVGEADAGAVDALFARADGEIAALLRGAAFGQRLKEGLTVVLTGRPNVGKSSLLNALSGTERAIVTAIPGTTRDVVEEALNLRGIPVRALDTAGLRDTADVVEKMGVERAKEAAETADVVIAVLDAEAGVSGEDAKLLRSLGGRPAVVAVNKADAAPPDAVVRAAQETAGASVAVIAVSAVQRTGLETLGDAVVRAATGADGDAFAGAAPLVTSARHAHALSAARETIAAARETLADALPLEFVAVDTYGALQQLGEITGETAREEIIAGIFRRFCLGK